MIFTLDASWSGPSDNVASSYGCSPAFLAVPDAQSKDYGRCSRYAFSMASTLVLERTQRMGMFPTFELTVQLGVRTLLVSSFRSRMDRLYHYHLPQTHHACPNIETTHQSHGALRRTGINCKPIILTR